MMHFEIRADGHGNIRAAWLKPNKEPHVGMFLCGDDIDAQAAEINRHLTEHMDCPAVSPDSIAAIKAIAAIEWRPERLAAAAERKEQARVAYEARVKEKAETEAKAKARKEAEQAAFRQAVRDEVERQQKEGK